MPDDPDYIVCEIATNKNVSVPGQGAHCASIFYQVRQRYPDAEIMVAIGGYDEDPRSLWEILEVREFVVAFVKQVRVLLKTDFSKWHLHEGSAAMIAMCLGVGEQTYDPATKTYTIVIDE